MYGETEAKMKGLLGKSVKKIFMNSSNLKFETDFGNYVFGVSGDCCSSSYFYDFYGVKNLLKNGRIIDIKEVEIDSEKAERESKARAALAGEDYYVESLACYGYQFTTIDPEFGEVTSVFSFRNESNGYYGGSLESANDDTDVRPEIIDDVVEIKTP